ncbi:gamma-glutamyl hydrolase A isoform X1 [Nilaparvata lugens]|uniref:gamma-glutamyl hydrolase A isoform X1 n=1 Tax=Nilaparvata lugens TaxID=108931 RepID=UPI000B97D280|nr:gamma-glutamyl hydrolase A isoform X1 [Nilaparvata lugens]
MIVRFQSSVREKLQNRLSNTHAGMEYVLQILSLMLGLVRATDRPVIGILTHEITSDQLRNITSNSTSFLPTSYVKAVEGSGARVVPIFLGKDEEYYLDLMKNINGLLYPGGDADFDVANGYASTGHILYKMAKKVNDNGGHMPILGICLGFELLMHVANNNKELRTDCNATNTMLALRFKPDFQDSKLFSDADPSILHILSTQPVTANFHKYCVTEQNFTKQGLDKEWKILSLNDDSNALEFVSTFESKKYPFVGLQYHPEKNVYDWKISHNNSHSIDSIYASRFFFDWLVKESRKSTHKFLNQSIEINSLINNHSPIYTTNENITFQEFYAF